MDIYDYVQAHTLGEVESEQIVVNDDYLEVSSVIQERSTVVVKGYSHNTGDTATYVLNYDQEVGLWAL